MFLNKSIGGYFELESNNLASSFYHDKAIALNSARNSLEYILRINNYKKILIPYYSCDVILQPLKRLRISFEFYHLDNGFFPILDSLFENEAILYINYFGLTDSLVYSLKEKFKNIIIDNSQAFFTYPVKGVSTFYSPRKFFGIPDGGFLYPNKTKRLKLDVDKSFDRVSHLITRVENGAEVGYNLFKENEAKLDNLPLKNMSNITRKLLYSIDFNLVIQKRNANFNILHNTLKHNNELTEFIDKQNVNGPLVYPYLKKGNDNLRVRLIKNRIYVAKYWPNVINWLEKENSFELHLFNHLIPLPIDQRYGENEMERILSLI